MTLDSEDDRKILIDLINKATISGQAVFAIADLITRIQSATIAKPSPARK